MKHNTDKEGRGKGRPKAIALLGLLALAGQAIAQDTALYSMAATVERVRHVGHGPPISDDGRDLDRVPEVNEMVIGRRGGTPAPLHVDLFNEQGRLVRSLTWDEPTTRKFAVGLHHLAPGRYLARIQGGGQVALVRFRKGL